MNEDPCGTCAIGTEEQRCKLCDLTEALMNTRDRVADMIENEKENKKMAKAKRLTRDMILNIDDFKMEDVDVPEWGGTLTVKSMNGTERDAFESSLLDPSGQTNKPNMINIRAKLVALTVIDPETKQPMFTSADIELLGTKSAGALDRIFTVAQRLSKITDKDVEAMAKN